jgi:hypothetical protein
MGKTEIDADKDCGAFLLGILFRQAGIDRSGNAAPCQRRRAVPVRRPRLRSRWPRS